MYTRDIRQWIFSLHEDDLILAKGAYEKYFKNMKEATFYQLLARLNNEKVIGKIAKGLYYKPHKENFDILPEDDKLIAFFTNKYRNGMIVGEKMLEKYGIIESRTNKYKIYTNVIEIKTHRSISNLEVEYLDIDYKDPIILKTIDVLELIEIVDNYNLANVQNIAEMLKSFALEYNEDTLFKVLMAKSYKKRNIACIKKILDRYNVPNNLNRGLNTASKYQIPKKIIEALKLD